MKFTTLDENSVSISQFICGHYCLLVPSLHKGEIVKPLLRTNPHCPLVKDLGRKQGAG